MSVWKQSIDRLIAQRILVEADIANEEKITGLIVQRSDEFIALQEINSDAEYDGIEVLHMEGIGRLMWSGTRLLSLQTLMTTCATFVPDPPRLSLDSRIEIFRSVSDAYGHVGVNLDALDEYHFGELVALDDAHVHLRAFAGKHALYRYDVLLDLDVVSRFEADGKYERRLISLFENP